MAISDFEKVPSNVFRQLFSGIQNSGCWFHFTHAIWKKAEVLGLSTVYKREPEFSSRLRKLMALPWLPEGEIIGMFSQLETQNFEMGEIVNKLINTFMRYYKRPGFLENIIYQ